MTEDEDKEAKRVQDVRAAQALEKVERQRRAQEEEKTEQESRAQKAALDLRRIEKYLEHERQMLELKAQPIKCLCGYSP